MTDRQRALTVIGDVCERNSFLKDSLNKIYDSNATADHAYLWRVTKGVIERLMELDLRIGSLSSMKPGRMHPILRNTLRLGAYEILYMDSIPVFATVNECVNMVRHSPASKAAGMANAILRRLENAPAPKLLADGDNSQKGISSRYSLPLWLVKQWNSRYGTEWTKQVGEAFLKDHPLTLRINSLKTTRDELYESFLAAGIKTAKHPLSEYALLLLQKSPVRSLPGYDDGLFYVQDIGSISVCELSGIKAGDKVLDLCAAPGGKTLFAAELATSSGCVASYDISEKRLERLNDNIRRGGFKNIITKKADATKPNHALTKGFDVVLADVPCSGLGVCGRKPEIKYRIRPGDIDTLSDIQKKILNNARSYVKGGGKLVYSTCTLSPRENEEQIADFRAKNPGFRVLVEKLFVPGEEENNNDGFYICVMQQNDRI